MCVASRHLRYLDLVLDAGRTYGAEKTFFLACGPMTDAYCGNVEWVAAAAMAHGVRAFLLDQRGFACDCCGHPGSKADAQMADRTVAFIKDKMGWAVVEDQ